jgi:hypothetical protein
MKIIPTQQVVAAPIAAKVTGILLLDRAICPLGRTDGPAASTDEPLREPVSWLWRPLDIVEAQITAERALRRNGSLRGLVGMRLSPGQVETGYAETSSDIEEL